MTKKLNVDIDIHFLAGAMEFLYRVDEETSLVVELMDVRDELNAIRTVLAQQRDVLSALSRLYQSWRLGYKDPDGLDDPKPAMPSSVAWDGVPTVLPGRPMLQNQVQMREAIQIVEKNIGAVHGLSTTPSRSNDLSRICSTSSSCIQTHWKRVFGAREPRELNVQRM